MCLCSCHKHICWRCCASVGNCTWPSPEPWKCTQAIVQNYKRRHWTCDGSGRSDCVTWWWSKVISITTITGKDHPHFRQWKSNKRQTIEQQTTAHTCWQSNRHAFLNCMSAREKNPILPRWAVQCHLKMETKLHFDVPAEGDRRGLHPLVASGPKVTVPLWWWCC